MIIKCVLWVTCAANLLALGLGLECPTECKCDGNKVDCSRINLKVFPDTIPANATVLNLVGNRIRELDRNSLQKLTSIQQLCLQSNNITKLNSEIFKSMTNLLRMDFSYNQISEVHKRAFTGLSQLGGLILNNNRIDKINGAFTRTHELTSLNLANNELTEISEEEFSKLKKLKYLDLGSNQITTIHPKAFENLKDLRYLILQNNRITSLDLSFSTRSLSVVDFTRNALVRMPKGLPSSVTDLRGGNNKIGSIEKDDLRNMTRLQLLTLNENSIARIHDDAFEGSRNLKEIWLASNELTSLPKHFPAGLIKLFLNSNKIKMIEKDAFNGNRYLQYLTIEMNEITDISPKAFSQLKGLDYLNLQGNQLARLSRDVIVGMNSLEILTLANNPIASIEPHAFDDLDALTKLDMSYNEERGIKIGMDILKAMPKLKELNLMNSPGLTKSLFDQIKDSRLSRTKSVKIIDLRYNNLLNLPTEFRSTFPNLTMIKLTNNAWHCDSELIPLKRYLETPKIRFSDNTEIRPVCCTPDMLKGKAITDVPDEQFKSYTSDGEETVVNNEEREKAEKADKLTKGDEANKLTEGDEANKLTEVDGTDTEKVNLSLAGVEVKNTGEETRPENPDEPKSRRKRRKGNRKSKRSRKDRKGSKKRRRRRRSNGEEEEA